MQPFAIIDANFGNQRSVFNASIAAGANVKLTKRPLDLRNAPGIILPGVGAFGAGMELLRSSGVMDTLEEEVLRKGKPFLGICFGLQALASKGFEYGEHKGLGWIDGTVEKIETPPGDQRYPIPHIGWNDVDITKTSAMFRGLEKRATFYFVHSYVLKPRSEEIVSGVCDYGTKFVASVEYENLCATQFHPEKSHKAGIKVLSNWFEWALKC
jgi:imidazole glycerol-phosphate synthase subunit HisH